jgi:DNA-binding GntR family transcriptional regulator
MQNKSLRQKAYEKIKKAIVTLRFEMGKSLNERELSSELKLGRTPIREALQQLANEGLVVIVPRKGAYVSTVSLADFQKMLDTRFMVETYCARRAAGKVSNGDLQRLRELLKGIEPLVAGRDIDGLLTVDRQVHMAIVSCLGNEYIEQIANQLYDRVARLWHLSFKNMDASDLRDRLASHHQILDALDGGDADASEEAVKRHIDRFVERIHRNLGSRS